MKVLLLVPAVLVLLIALACWRDARRGRRAWDAQPSSGVSTGEAARTARRTAAATVALGAFLSSGGDAGGG